MTALIVICATAISLSLLNSSADVPSDTPPDEEYILVKRKPNK